MPSGHPKTMENKLPSPPLPAWERIRVRAVRWTTGICEGDGDNALAGCVVVITTEDGASVGDRRDLRLER